MRWWSVVLWLVSLLVISLNPAVALFEDQIGKSDWRLQFVGCPTQIFLDRSKAGKPSDSVIVATDHNVIASLSPTTGEIAWRQTQEQRPGVQSIIANRGKLIASIASNGRVVRVWDKPSGYLKWEKTLREESTSSNGAVTFIDDATVVALTDNIVVAFNSQTGDQLWKQTLEEKVLWFGLVRGSDAVTVVGGAHRSAAHVVTLDMKNGAKQKLQTLPAPWFAKQSCLLSGSILACAGDNGVHTVDVSSSPLQTHSAIVAETTSVRDLDIEGFVGVGFASSSALAVFRLSPTAAPALVVKFDQYDAVSAALTAEKKPILVAVRNLNRVSYFDLSTGQEETIWSAEITGENRAPAKQLALLIAGSERELLVVGQDCRVDFLVHQSSSLNLEWSRHEALAAISSVEMVDLPLSEAQANIEAEFASGDESILRTLSRRLSTQITQIRRALLHAGDEILSTTGLLGDRRTALSDWLDSLRNGDTDARKRKSNNNQEPFERDYFNLHKMIVVTTLNGKLYGLDNRQGAIVWQLWVGADLEPLSSVEGRSVPLFVQRTTAHYPFPAQCVFAAKHKTTGKGVLVTFDPISGKVVDRVQLAASVKQIALLPYTNANDIHSVIVVDNNNHATLHPNDARIPADSPIYLMSVVAETGELTGSRYNAASKKLEVVWTSTLGLDDREKVVHVMSKRFGEHVHSQGRVLGDRSVLYKYSNPNLVALAALSDVDAKDPKSAGGLLTIFLIDSVNGRVLYAGKHHKASGPVHMIHCENWLTYSFWNEKARRMELNVLEMFEGHVQSDPQRFSSLAPTLQPPIVMKQGYIFPQGVSAITVTETDRGMTNRNVLIAMPFGGILEVPKSFLDPRRPIEPTMEHREEGLIPYMPEIPVATENILNYNQTAVGVRAIKTSASGLESTSLMLAYGLDLFFTRLNPSGTFDILKDDFDHLLISLVLFALIVASVVSKKFAKHRDLKQAWR
uniref:ER membrane protein complex subunit 1 n=1 Tax=Plectus sambesii TaxID=2011161 RepID=A0A914W7A1_9BILA